MNDKQIFRLVKQALEAGLELAETDAAFGGDNDLKARQRVQKIERALAFFEVYVEFEGKKNATTI